MTYEPLSFAICDHCGSTFPWEYNWCIHSTKNGPYERCHVQLRKEGPKPSLDAFDALIYSAEQREKMK